MKRRTSPASFSALIVTASAMIAASLLAPHSLRADDIKLKDGTKISGTIVGFEENSFKVKTSFGFAIVQKDQVVSISMSDAPKSADKSAEPSADKPPAPEAAKQPAKKDAVKSTAAPQPLPAMSGDDSDPAAKIQPVIKSTSSPAAIPAPVPVAVKSVAKSAPAPTPAPAPAPSAKPVNAAPAVAANPAPMPPAPIAAAPPKPAAPEPIKEAVNGNVYTNETYRFHMYKPPDWDVIATAPKVLPGAITAMGTGDDMTYLLIGQEPAGKSLATDMDTTEKRLRDVMVNFRALDDKQITVSGAAATEHRFRGSVDQHDWSGVVVLVPRGEKLFTIFGMTRADNDLVQIQENVIARAISSLQFTN
jgi:hypothetical protein